MYTCISLIFQEHEDPVSHTLELWHEPFTRWFSPWTEMDPASASCSCTLVLLFISQFLVGSTHDVRKDTADVLSGSRNLKWDRWFPGWLTAEGALQPGAPPGEDFFLSSLSLLLPESHCHTQEEWEMAIQESFLLNYALEWKQFSDIQTRFDVEGILFP